MAPLDKARSLQSMRLILDDVEALLSETRQAVQHPLEDVGVVALPLLKLADDT